MELSQLEWALRNDEHEEHFIYCFHADRDIKIERGELLGKVASMKEEYGAGHKVSVNESESTVTIIDFNASRR
ncbi:hypothetical protein [Salinibacter ruber]|uniref:hypothetical protein n=1 Tax=Salinibacter ruber TaxID=146919 RepID=UPI002167EE88|nr:hypothetical protein [Salinibacter ruber]MCS3698085.1 hypothetical protein [Salinibacter ruber]